MSLEDKRRSIDFSSPLLSGEGFFICKFPLRFQSNF
jgi:hypothetical protein